MNILIIIKDVNDNSPKFLQEIYKLKFSEDTPRGKQLIELKAIDPDLEPKLNYRIEHMDRNLFALINMDDQVQLLFVIMKI